MPGITGKFGLGVQNVTCQRLIEFCQENALVIPNTLFQQHKRRLYTWTLPDSQYQNQIDYILCSQRWRSSVQSAETILGADCGSDHLLPLLNSDSYFSSVQFSSVQFSLSVMSHSLRPHESQHARPLYPSQTPTLLQIHQKNVHEVIMPFLENWYKTSHYILQVDEHMVSRAWVHSDPVCLAKQCAVLSHSVLPILCDPINCSPPASSVYGDSPGKNTGVSCHALLCRDQLDKQGFWKRDVARECEMRHKNSEKSKDQGTNTASKVKVPKVNPSQLYYTFSHNWKNMWGVKL